MDSARCADSVRCAYVLRATVLQGDCLVALVAKLVASVEECLRDIFLDDPFPCVGLLLGRVAEVVCQVESVPRLMFEWCLVEEGDHGGLSPTRMCRRCASRKTAW